MRARPTTSRSTTLGFPGICSCTGDSRGLYYTAPRTRDTWWINDELGENIGFIKCPAKGSATLQVQGWLLHADARGYIPDSTLKFSTSPYSWCPHLTVSATGAAAEKWPEYLGKYEATTMTSCGRKVRERNECSYEVFNNVCTIFHFSCTR